MIQTILRLTYPYVGHKILLPYGQSPGRQPALARIALHLRQSHVGRDLHRLLHMAKKAALSRLPLSAWAGYVHNARHLDVRVPRVHGELVPCIPVDHRRIDPILSSNRRQRPPSTR